MPKRKRWLLVIRCEESVPDQDVLRVSRHPIDSRVLLDGLDRSLARVGGEGDGEPAAWVFIAEQHAGERGAELLAWVPDLQNRRDLIQPWHQDRTRRIEHDDGPWIIVRYLRDEPVLVAGQRQRLPVHPLPGGLVDDHDGCVALGRQGRSVADQAVRRLPAEPDLRPQSELLDYERRPGLIFDPDGQGLAC